MYIRKRSFFEIIFSLTVVFFVCMGIRFVYVLGATNLRWLCALIVFCYLALTKKLLKYVNLNWKMLLLIYLVWCMSTTLWSEVPLLSFSKSTLFSFNVIVMISAGALWVIKFGYARSLNWLFWVLVFAFISGFLGTATTSIFYKGLTWNPNEFGFLMAITSSYLFLKLYQNKKNKMMLAMWIFVLLIDIHFLVASYSRSSFVIFLFILGFFILSLPLSKKILVSISSFFLIVIVLVMTPVSYLESTISKHILKNPDNLIIDPNAPILLQSRSFVWQESYRQAMKGGIMGGGFSVTIGDANFSNKQIEGIGYGREKGNSQFAIMEETGLIGLVLYLSVLILFFTLVFPWYFRLKGADKVAMGLVLGSIFGLLAESIVEAWWDSAAGPELICFWTLVGVVYGMIYLQKRKFLAF
ncbi:MAG: hypothetical protein ACD_46C00708G0010 [uncultured bacterium]|nr:MAG: hypothetical protein ACD_46C00708G0010 [uncultured bacterium]OGT25418.1 MAG: hypothetical protein A3B71_05045 [Gammaproteobacteria bacterium RIFCSPHIGHO2_02_FULL_42_43]OGT28572.1 MAG: hypothetical protein A2624_04170 [Gammaproteobacteria bacterium RIFCSPHIGHO2_01_FULL_42_8]OGT51370.1 MAG: hypothetical protein A3E54_04810 [Gammaproteobacteria bacterium RIFCSPHIGHO2_12_FULL_41_25]OGT62072.1 MAG: hypothetical protein A3I77_03740 [Gammaproteobacteria bacterium RIFCSPLOWO2_02_FULL_42_14]OGT